jgi:hypothetical protein
MRPDCANRNLRIHTHPGRRRSARHPGAHFCLSPGPISSAAKIKERFHLMHTPTAYQPAPAAASTLGRAITLLAAMLALTLTMSLGVSAARAGTLAVVSCKNPATNAGEPTNDWTATWTSVAFPYAGNVNECAQGSNLKSYVGAEVNQEGSSGPTWEYSPPEGDEITGGEISAAFSIPGGLVSPYTGAAGILAPKLLFDEADLLEGVARPAGGVAGSYEGIYKLSGHTGGKIWMYAFCEPPGSSCPGNQSKSWYWALAEMRWADILLANNATPAGTGFSGTIASSTTPVSGTQNLTFDAKDEGVGAPGIYLVKATLDGQSVYDATPNTNNGVCQSSTPSRFAGVYEFASPYPCKTSESVVIPIDTAAVKDGTHELVVTVIDAAGDESIVYTRQITTENAPAVLAAPSVAGSAQVGSTLTGTPGSFSAPEGAGALSAISGQWLRCTDAEAKHCTAIAGATSSTYSPASSDAGYYLVYSSTASDHDGTTVADSQPTVAVSEPAGQVAGFGSQSSPAGTGGIGGPGGAGGSGGLGSGGLTVNLNTSNGPLGSNSPWQITLHAKPGTVHKGATVYFTGELLTKIRPPQGNHVYLRARLVKRTGKGRKHTSYGRWVTFDATRTNTNGQYTVTHKFRLSGPRIYQFVATAPQEADYRNAAGISRAVTITERPRRRP